MFLTVHATVGAVLGQSVPHPWIAFILGFMSHFVVDLIPHGDQAIMGGGTHKQRMIRLFSAAGVDLLILGGLALFWYTTFPFPYPVSIIAGAFGAMLPDGLQAITMLSHNRFLPRFKIFHDWFHIHTHPRFVNATIHYTLGLPLQGIVWFIIQKNIGG